MQCQGAVPTSERQDEIGARVPGLGLVELVGQRAASAGAPPCGGERIDGMSSSPWPGDDVTGDGEGFADEGVGLVACSGAVAVERRGPGWSRASKDGYSHGVGDLLDLRLGAARMFLGDSPRRMRTGTAAAASWAALEFGARRPPPGRPGR